MQFMRHEWIFQLVIGVLCIISIYGFIVEGIVILPYVGMIVLLLYSYSQYQRNDEREIDQLDRISWFFTILTPIDPNLRYNIRHVHQFMPELVDKNNLTSKPELGIEQFTLPEKRVLPDLTAAEIELAKLEERTSIILGSIIFIPILFALLHLFREVSLSIFLLELYMALILGTFVLQTQQHKYSLAQWNNVFAFLSEHRSEIITNPRKFLASHRETTKRYLHQELGIQVEKSKNHPSIEFFDLFATFLIDIVPELRENYLDKVLKEIDQLPTKQELIEKRWATYTVRVMMISIAATALGALFSSMANFSIPLLSTPDFQLSSTTFLYWGEYILLIGLNSQVFLRWYNPIKVITRIIILTVVYFGFYWFNSILI